MDSMRSLKKSLPGTSPSKGGGATAANNGGNNNSNSGTGGGRADSAEQVLEAFRAAALSVTMLFKASTAAETRSRDQGYQDCLEDLLAFLDKEGMGAPGAANTTEDASSTTPPTTASTTEGARVRRWVRERLVEGGRDSAANTAAESEDELLGEAAEEGAEMPELPRMAADNDAAARRTAGGGPMAITASSRPDAPMRSDSELSSASSGADTVTEERVRGGGGGGGMQHGSMVAVPTQDTFTFQVPREAGVSEITFRAQDPSTITAAAMAATGGTTRLSRTRHGNGSHRVVTPRTSRRTQQKRKLDFAEIFDLGSLGYPRDDSRDSKRGRFV